MTELTEQQKRLLFDYALGIIYEAETAEAQELIFANKQAADFVAKTKVSLSPLDSLAGEQCPEELAESTIWRLKQAARASQLHLETLIAAEQTRRPSVALHFWDTYGRRLAVAALLLIVAAAMTASFNTANRYAHQKYWQNQCAAQLAGVFQGIANYRADNDNQMPAVAAAAGSPWWKVGYQGPENHSNTRRMWLLVKNNYAKPSDFVCPCKNAKKTLQFDSLDLNTLNDFPSRNYVTYSFRIMCPKAVTPAEQGRMVVAADVNPLFEALPECSASGLSVEPTERLLRANSANHNGRGQNVLFCDGSIIFTKSRLTDLTGDDIFTLQGTPKYKGVELPASDIDSFLAP